MPDCPSCGSRVKRINRRTVDKFSSLFNPILRYRCGNEKCFWEGNMPDPSISLTKKRRSVLIWVTTIAGALLFGVLFGKYINR